MTLFRLAFAFSLVLHATALKQPNVQAHVPQATGLEYDYDTFMKLVAERESMIDENGDEDEDEDLEQNAFDPKHHKPPHHAAHSIFDPKIEEPKGNNRCNSKEIAKFHRGMADDLYGMFNKGSTNLNWPDYTVGGKQPNCTLDVIFNGTDFNGQHFAWCQSKRFDYSYKCTTCYTVAVKMLMPNKQGGLGCIPACKPALIGCLKARDNIGELQNCLGTNLQTCVSCLQNTAIRLGDCIGDTSPFTPSSLFYFLEQGFQSNTVKEKIIEYVQGASYQAMIEEQRDVSPTN